MNPLERHEPDLQDQIERAAARVRAEPDSGFEARVLASVARARRTPAPLRLVRSPAFAAAATLALLLTAGALVVVATRPTAPHAPASARSDVLDEIDAWLALDDTLFVRTNFASFTQELDAADTPLRFDPFDDDLDAEDWM